MTSIFPPNMINPVTYPKSKSYSTNPRFQDRNDESIIIAPKVSCKATKNDDLSPGPNRRNTLMALGGLAAILGGGSASLAGPFWPDDGPIPGVSLLTTEFPLTSKADFPKALDSVIGVDVPRPRESRRSRKEKELMVIDVELSHTDMPVVEFDVYVNGEHDNDRDHRPGQKTLIKAKLVGSFTSSILRNNRAGCFKLGLDKIIEDLGAQDDEILEVSLVPRSGQEAIIIKDARIEYSRN